MGEIRTRTGRNRGEGAGEWKETRPWRRVGERWKVGSMRRAAGRCLARTFQLTPAALRATERKGWMDGWMDREREREIL